MTFPFYFIMTSQPLLKKFFCSSEILELCKAKPQSKSIQWFNFSYMGKTNKNSEKNIISNFLSYDIILSCMTSQNYYFFNKTVAFAISHEKLLL